MGALALTAVIDASHAGDAGRTFTVLADHVRALALRAEAPSARVDELADAIRTGVR